MFNFLKKHWLLIGLAAIASLLAVIWFIAKTTPEEKLPKLESVLLPGQAIAKTTQIAFTTQEIEKNAPVLSLIRGVPFTQPQINKIAQKLNFGDEPFETQDAILGPISTWTNEENSLTITSTIRQVIFKRDLSLLPPPEKGQFPQLETAKEQFLSLLEDLGLHLPQQEAKVESRFIKFEGFTPTTSLPEEASLLELNFNPEFKGIKIVNDNPNATTAQVWFDRQGKVVKFEWRNEIGSLKEEALYPLKTEQEINQLIYTEGKVILVGGARPSLPEAQRISSINITQAMLAYFMPQEGNVIQPIFIFTGLAAVSDGNSYPVWIYVPAIKSEYFTTGPQR